MVQVGAYQQVNGYGNQAVNGKANRQTKTNAAERTQSAGYVDQKKEASLSSRAQDVLKRLRNKYGDRDFMVADFNNGEEAKEILSRGTKEFSVLFSSDELEKMASDEDYMQKKIDEMEGAVRMSKDINAKFGHEQAFGLKGTEGVEIAKIGIAFHDDGTTSYFAELEKSSAKQRERIEASREQKRAKEKAEKELESYAKNSADAKRTTVSANSMEELLEKIKNVDWNAVKAENLPENGRNYDFSI